jgi:prephenate dehydrogenase
MANSNPSLQQTRVGIVGLGLMGGSLALALRGKVAHLVGVERQAIVRQMALRESIVDQAIDTLAPDSPLVDLLVLATPVQAILQTLSALPALRPAGGYVLDLGSTKRAITAAMAALPDSFAAIGGHPMCGKETSGLLSATADLYRGQLFVICPTSRTTPAMQALVLELIAAIEARPVFLEAAEHDNIVAAVSHLPYLVSAALMRSVVSEAQWAISASGFRDTTRLAGTNPQMMVDILLTNRDAIFQFLQDYESDLGELRRLLALEDEAGLMEWMAAAQIRYAAYRRYRSVDT